MESKTLGALLFDTDNECRKSSTIKVPALGNIACTFTFPELDEDARDFPTEFETAVRNFLGLPNGWLENCSPYLWEYYRDMIEMIGQDDIDPIDADDDILTRIELDPDIEVRWDCDENDVYVSFGGGCDWEIEHGLQITLRNGKILAKVGDYDGHVSNADAYDREDFRNVVYVKRSML
jgi:hypothetical protein